MRRMNIDTIFRLRMPYRSGQLARITQAIAEEKALIGDLSLVRLGEEDTIREITVETESDEQTKRVEARLRNLPGIELLSLRDTVFERHQGGKIHSTSKVPLENVSDLRIVYTPGVARVALAIKENPKLAYEYTSLGNSIGIFTNGTRVLGLGDIGPVASLPVMEGKAVLYDKFAGISATPILLHTKNPDEFIETVVQIASSFGGIHLEDISSPECYKIEDELIKRLNKPVMHDDQHGTAVASLAAVINAAKLAHLSLENASVGQIGLGAAGSAIARLMLAYGVKKVYVADRNQEAVTWLESLGGVAADLPTIMAKCDIVIAATGKPGLIQPQDIRKGQIIFSLSNPNPEIEPLTALSAGAAFASDGRSINNALAFPGIFKGALQSRAESISNEMKIAAAKAIASIAGPSEIVPDPLNPLVHQAVTKAVYDAAYEQGLANQASLLP